MEFINTILLLIIGWVGYLLFSVFHFPSPTIMGAIAIVGLIKIVGITIPAPHQYFVSVLQILMGLYIGVKITRELYNELIKLWLPACLISLWAIGITIVIGFLLSRLTEMSILTALLGATPGGVSTMGIIAQSIGEDVATVSFLQLLRLMITLIFFPFLMKRSFKDLNKGLNDKQSESRVPVNNFFTFQFLTTNIKKLFSKKVLLAIFFALVGGILGTALSLPAGAMIGALTMIAVVSLKGASIESPPLFIRNFMRIGMGTVIGYNFSWEAFSGFYSIILPVLLVTFLIFFSSTIMAKLIEKISGWNHTTCSLATTPVGFSSMTILAYDINSQPFQVSMLHLSRLVTIKIMVPLLIMILK